MRKRTIKGICDFMERENTCLCMHIHMSKRYMSIIHKIYYLTESFIN